MTAVRWLVARLERRPEAFYGQLKDWRGMFVKDGQPIPGTGFRIRQVSERGEMIALVYVDYPDRMPSDRIRVFTLHADFPTPLSDPPDHAPISGHVREALDAGEGQIKLCLGLPSDVDPLDVSTDWTGVFTKNGHDLPDSDFRITEAAKDHTWAIVAGTTYPSKTVRLYPPHAAKRAETAEQ